MLQDGPAKGSYQCQRAPVFLRAVVSDKGKTDVLDQVEDIPATNETVSVYVLVSSFGLVSIRTKAGCHWGPAGTYEHLSDVDGHTLRDNEVWQVWALDAFKERFDVEPLLP